MQIFKLSFFAILLFGFQTVFAVESNEIFPKQVPITVSDSCDAVYFRGGDITYVKVIEINETTIKYKFCNNPDGPVTEVSKNSIYKIVYKNGDVQWIEAKKTGTNTLVVIGFISSILGLIVLALPFGLLAVIPASIGLGQIEKKQQKGSGLAKWAIGIGIFDIIFGIIAIMLAI